MDPPFIEDQTEADVDNEEFCFESDHLALRGNPDYAAVLRTIAILQAQRIQATKEVDKLSLAEKKALDDPEAFVAKLAAGEELGVPAPISIFELPKIDFAKYNVTFPELPKTTTTDSATNPDLVVRGRVFDQTKPETFNQLWTCEEQRRLEELLVEYPPEPIEMRRFAKIARALGNRTTKQVASRIQKFFKKLHSVGMPVPGRLPKAQRQYASRNHRLHKHSLRPSTFFPAHDVPVTMPDDDDFTSGIPLDHLQRAGSSHANSVTSLDREQPSQGFIIVDEHSDDDKETNSKGRILKLLQRVRKDKEKDNVDRPYSEHIGFECDFCSVEPIIGTRWHCVTCKDKSVDYCSDCLITQIVSDDSHPVHHKFNGVRVSHVASSNAPRTNSPFEEDSENDEDSNKAGFETNVFDKDYMPSKFSKHEQYNYLDPNFLPE
ncbi:unnamed protein product [Hermetia illucens]|uniref:ZZ-type zinc finger-containing protein 3 n=1 Tax=Hermetia illucens TaxID=343691 RepID=A0A7R8UH85_HERIL|nr:ZZ-type zinc finger-containing protein 3 [Hermetia illucens]CAD7080756.1 unnamed protein product [Hermetia illucens]